MKSFWMVWHFARNRICVSVRNTARYNDESASSIHVMSYLCYKCDCLHKGDIIYTKLYSILHILHHRKSSIKHISIHFALQTHMVAGKGCWEDFIISIYSKLRDNSGQISLNKNDPLWQGTNIPSGYSSPTQKLLIRRREINIWVK